MLTTIAVIRMMTVMPMIPTTMMITRQLSYQSDNKYDHNSSKYDKQSYDNDDKDNNKICDDVASDNEK